MAGNLREQNTEIKEPGNQFAMLIPRFAFTAFLAVVLLAVSATPVFADTLFDTAKNGEAAPWKCGGAFLIKVRQRKKSVFNRKFLWRSIFRITVISYFWTIRNG